MCGGVGGLGVLKVVNMYLDVLLEVRINGL